MMPGEQIDLAVVTLFRAIWVVSKAEALLRFNVDKAKAQRMLSFSPTDLLEMTKKGIKTVALPGEFERSPLHLV